MEKSGQRHVQDFGDLGQAARADARLVAATYSAVSDDELKDAIEVAGRELSDKAVVA